MSVANRKRPRAADNENAKEAALNKWKPPAVQQEKAVGQGPTADGGGALGQASQATVVPAPADLFGSVSPVKDVWQCKEPPPSLQILLLRHLAGVRCSQHYLVLADQNAQSDCRQRTTQDRLRLLESVRCKGRV